MKVEIAGAGINGEIVIGAPPESVFEALTTPAELEQWWGQDGLYRTHDWVIDLRPGGERSCNASSPDGMLSAVKGVHLEVDPPRVLAHTWNPSWDPTLPETVVRYTLSAVPEGTLLKIEHTGFDAAHEKSRDGHAEGWTRVLGWLSKFSESRAAR